MKFRPCIDLHNGCVKQIVGSTLSDSDAESLRTNFAASHPPSYYADMYRRDGLTGGHVIMLGPNNDEAALDALHAYPNGLQIGGGINAANAGRWLDEGASGVIVTSYVFKDGKVLEDRLHEMVKAVGKDKLIIDLSCRKRGDDYFVVTDRWQKFTSLQVNEEALHFFARFCDEFLIHAVDVEGKCNGIDAELTRALGAWTPIPTTYAGGVRNLEDLRMILDLGKGRLDATIGSALDIFGGAGIRYDDAVSFHRLQNA